MTDSPQKPSGGLGAWGEESAAYLLSLPERVLRSASALAGGLLREAGDVTVPAAVRKGRIYRTMVEATLRFLIEQVGQVEGTFPLEGRLVEDFAVRRAAGNGIEMAGIIAFRASPVWVMAALADISGAGKQVVREIAGSLREEGLLESGRSVETVEQMLDGLERCSGRLAEAVNTPPLDVKGLREEWSELRREAAAIPGFRIPSPQSVRAAWSELKREAEVQRRSVFALSSLLAIGAAASLPEDALRLSRSARRAAGRTGGLFAGAILDHYRATLGKIRKHGFAAYWGQAYRPYLRGAAEQFSPNRESLTER